MRQVWLAGLAALWAASAGCSRCGGDDAAKPAAAEPAATTAPAQRSERRTRQPDPKLGRRTARRIEPITVAESEAVLGLPAGARVMHAPTKPSRGERVQATYCFEGTAPAAAAKAIAEMLETKGWTDVHTRARPDQVDRATLAAQHSPYRVSASVRRVPAPNCSGDAGHSFATLTVHKIGGAKQLKEQRPQ